MNWFWPLSILTAATVMLATAAGLDPGPNLQAPPEPLPPDLPQLLPLLVDANGQEIVSKGRWYKQRDAVAKQWLDFMGGLPKKRAPLRTEFLETEHLDGFTRQYVRYQVFEGEFTDGYLLTPAGVTAKKLPAVVVFHSTVTNQARLAAGVDTWSPERMQGVHLVQRGYIVWCPRNFIYADGSNFAAFSQTTRVMLDRRPGWTGMTRMTFDAIRAADFLESLPNVDRGRIGCLGHSLGAKVALFAPAFDGRYKASVSSEGGIGLGFSNWDAIWYLGPGIKEPGFKLENHQVLAMIAPRAFLLIAGESADNDRSWAFIEAALPVYDLLGVRGNLGWFNHRGGHRYTAHARSVAEAFLDRYLKEAVPAEP
jgi:dienelactone hydrolase